MSAEFDRIPYIGIGGQKKKR